MAASRDAARWIVLNPVKPDRREEFEDFVRDVVVPAVKQVRAHLLGMWQVLRPEAQGDDGALIYGLLFYGDVPFSDWDLDTLLTEAHGDEEGTRRAQEFMGFLDGEQQLHAFSGELSTD
jgi:hypothetical protein